LVVGDPADHGRHKLGIGAHVGEGLTDEALEG
jgi:hypothetical protein